MVLVSRLAGPWQFGHFTLTHESMPANGDSPVPVGSYFLTFGKTTGKSSSGTATVPHFGQWIMGMGSPQYLCLENTQSRNLYLMEDLPNSSAICWRAVSESLPVYDPELINRPSPIQQSNCISLLRWPYAPALTTFDSRGFCIADFGLIT